MQRLSAVALQPIRAHFMMVIYDICYRLIEGERIAILDCCNIWLSMFSSSRRIEDMFNIYNYGVLVHRMDLEYTYNFSINMSCLYLIFKVSGIRMILSIGGGL